MKYRNLITCICISIFTNIIALANDQNVPANATAKKTTPTDEAAVKAKELNLAFSNLPEEKRKKYLTLRVKAHKYFSDKRYIDSLVTVLDMRQIFKDDPITCNLLGAIYMEFRDFSKAREVFKYTVDLTGNSPKVLFNLAELEFCDNKWLQAIKLFEELLEKTKSMQANSFIRLSEFKILLSKLALAKDTNKKTTSKQKEKYLTEAKKLAEKYTYLDDSPYFYYANAAIEYFSENTTNAAKKLLSARKVYANTPNLLRAWNDTMVEFGYIESHYGKHYSEGAVEK